jgi:hypothetical protein
LSSDQFQDFYIAFVTNRNKTDFENGIVGLTINDPLIRENLANRFTVIESKAFFECYRQLMDSLIIVKVMGENQFPIIKKIISNDQRSTGPNYLANKKINLKSLLVETNKRLVEINIDDDWPSDEEVSVNKRQYEAIKYMFTNEIAIIQGPPGTGKTFVGVKFIEILLDNFKQLNSNGNQPILIICTTNHALDNILEKILSSTSIKPGELIRVGKRSKSDKLKNYNLHELQRKKEFIQQIKEPVYVINKNKRDTRDQLAEMSNIIKHLDNNIVKKSFLFNMLKHENDQIDTNETIDSLNDLNFFDLKNLTRQIILHLIENNLIYEEFMDDGVLQINDGSMDIDDFTTRVTKDQLDDDEDVDDEEMLDKEFNFKYNLELDEEWDETINDKIDLNPNVFFTDKQIGEILLKDPAITNYRNLTIGNIIAKMKAFFIKFSSLVFNSNFICKCAKSNVTCDSKTTCKLTVAFQKFKKNHTRAKPIHDNIEKKYNNSSDFITSLITNKSQVTIPEITNLLNSELDHEVFCHSCYKIIIPSVFIQPIVNYNQNLCSHRCLSTCHHPNECKLCKTEIEQKVPNCDHMILFNCGKAPTSADCTHECGKTLSCNHICQKQCNKPCLPCEELVEISTQCEHKAIVNIECCNQVKDFLLHKYCNQTCNKKLSCKHSCKGKCSECYYGYLHTPCQEPCKNLLICRHECQGLCSEYCPPCFKPCEIRCTHSKCSNPCYLRCDPCNEICDWKCEHIKCDQICSEICQREPCDAHCQKIVCSEGHKCVGFCGETCPPCYKCNKSGYHNFLAIGDESEEFDDFENCRFVKFDCMHVFEVNQITSVIKNKIDDGEIQMIICPICSIKQQFCKRFYREIKEATININIAKMQWNRNEE